MKILLCLAASLLIAGSSMAQKAAIPSAKPGVSYGATVSNNTSLTIDQLQEKLTADTVYTGKVAGEVVEVCKKKGCFMRLKRSNGEAILVRFKDYGFFMPQDIVGKTVEIEGVAKVKETSVERLKHWAEDAGKSKEEIEKINAPRTDIDIVANGVLVVR